MTNYEKIKSLTVEEMAKFNVKPFCYMNGYRASVDFYTTDQHIFNTREEAEEYELKWLLDKLDDETINVLLHKEEK